MTTSALVGLAIMIVSEAATLTQIEPFWSWNTPIAWTGFILFADSIVFRARGQSWIRSAPREFLWLSLASIPLWLVFEFYNRFIDNWHYVGLPENPLLRYFGFAWSFATIWPAIFEGAELVAVWRGSVGDYPAPHAPPARHNSPTHPVNHAISIALGAILLLWPLAWPSRYLAAPVWLGFIFLLDPINARLGGESLVAVRVAAGAQRGRGTVDIFVPADWESILEEVWPVVLSRVPAGYSLVFRPSALTAHGALKRAA